MAIAYRYLNHCRQALEVNDVSVVSALRGDAIYCEFTHGKNERGGHAVRMLGIMVLCTVCACSNQDQVPVPTSVTFEFVHGNDKDAPTYRASTSDTGLIDKVRAELQLPLQSRSLHINGAIAANADDNAPWKWAFVPDRWSLAQLSIEVCDAQPSYVNDNLDEWLKSVGSYCPWSSRVSREL